ncbi:MAG: hypothetical protein AB1390_09425 [Nitrospirota bacterium]
MLIDRIGNKQAEIHLVHTNKIHASRDKNNGVKKINSKDQASVVDKRNDEPQKEVKKFSQLMPEMINDYISQIKAQSGRLVKFYPPYPAGAEDRISMLKNFAAFRELIKRLTLPPEPEMDKAIGAEIELSREPKIDDRTGKSG